MGKGDKQENSEEALEKTCTGTSRESMGEFYINSISVVCEV